MPAVWHGGIGIPPLRIYVLLVEGSLSQMTRTRNTAAGSATIEDGGESPYSPDNLILYHTSLGLLETLVKRGVLTKNDFKKACQVLTRKYGLPANSIFAESPL